jgi:hypothetical protein
MVSVLAELLPVVNEYAPALPTMPQAASQVDAQIGSVPLPALKTWLCPVNSPLRAPGTPAICEALPGLGRLLIGMSYLSAGLKNGSVPSAAAMEIAVPCVVSSLAATLRLRVASVEIAIF